MVLIGMGCDLYKEKNQDRNSSSAHHDLEKSSISECSIAGLGGLEGT